ncbi:MAG TPA: hypothetical protein VF407_01055, partial [Polyangiaceae bacterium]
ALFALAFTLSATALVLAFFGPILSIAPTATREPDIAQNGLAENGIAEKAPVAAPPLPSPASEPEPVHVVDLAPIVIVGRRAPPALPSASVSPPITIEFGANAAELACAAWRPLEMGAGSVRDCIVRP